MRLVFSVAPTVNLLNEMLQGYVGGKSMNFEGLVDQLLATKSLELL